jgi:hypothetical protein
MDEHVVLPLGVGAKRSPKISLKCFEKKEV